MQYYLSHRYFPNNLAEKYIVSRYKCIKQKGSRGTQKAEFCMIRECRDGNRSLKAVPNQGLEYSFPSNHKAVVNFVNGKYQ